MFWNKKKVKTEKELLQSLESVLYQKVSKDFERFFDQYDRESYSFYKDINKDMRKINEILLYLSLYGNKNQKKNSFNFINFESDQNEFIRIAPYYVKQVSSNFAESKDFLDRILFLVSKTEQLEIYKDFILGALEWGRKNNKKIFEQAFLIILFWDWRIVVKELHEFLEKGDDNLVICFAFNLWHIYGDQGYEYIKMKLNKIELKRLNSLNKQIIERYKDLVRIPPKILK
jgi:hypothetical protein